MPYFPYIEPEHVIHLQKLHITVSLRSVTYITTGLLWMGIIATRIQTHIFQFGLFITTEIAKPFFTICFLFYFADTHIAGIVDVQKLPNNVLLKWKHGSWLP